MQKRNVQTEPLAVFAAERSLQAIRSNIRLDGLTSLRFFACVMIVFFHSAGFFIDIEFMRKWQLEQGVTFFFVLSGFILTYVHPSLAGWQETKQFLLARLGRVWPTHLVMSILTLCLLPCSCSAASVFWTNLFLLQSWIPRREYYFALNAVAWSISVELFFYFCFIFMIRPWKIGWLGKIALALGAILAFCVITQMVMASGGRGWLKFSEEFLLKINPLTRLLDFVIGMATAVLWSRFNSRLSLKKWQFTVLEALIISTVILEITQIGNAITLFLPALHDPFSYCLIRMILGPTFALLIFLIASQKGYITQALARPELVWLGEISYSIYMVHYVVLQCLSFYFPEFFRINWQLGYFAYVFLVILLSQLNFSFVENPCRKLVKYLASPLGKNISLSSLLLRVFSENFRSGIIAGILTVILGLFTAVYIQISQARFQFIDLGLGRRVGFGKDFLLDKVSMASAKDGVKIELTWTSLIEQKLNRDIELNFLDARKQMLVQYDQADMYHRLVHPGQSWSEIIYVPHGESGRNNWDSLGMRLCVHPNKHFSNYLAVEDRASDWWRTRLLIPLNKAALCRK